VKEDHVGGARGRCGAKEKRILGSGDGHYMEDLGVDGRIISRGVVKELGGESADWIIG
jgi:hypothetical protein